MNWIAFPLHPETPEEGRSLEDLFAGRKLDIPTMMTRLHQTAAQLKLPFGMRHRTYNSRRAQELGKWAESLNMGEAFHLAVFHAYFAEGKNIAEVSVLTKLAESIGLSGNSAEQALQAGTFRSAVDTDWQKCRLFNVTAVPTLVSGKSRLVGAQPYDQIRSLVLGTASEIL